MAINDDERLAATLQMEELRSQQQLTSDADLAARMRNEQQFDSDADLATRMQVHEQAWAQAVAGEEPRISVVADAPSRLRGRCGVPCGGSSALPLRLQAAMVHSALLWRSCVELMLSVFLVIFLATVSHLILALTLSSLLAPVFGLAATRWRDWRLALLHTIGTAGVVAVRGVAVPLSTSNALLGAAAAVCVVPTLHALWLALRWLMLLW